VTLLDGDEVRRLLSAGLGFSREDIATNIARIAFVAAEVTRHGGVAVCAPIAPFAAVRADARARVGATGAFVLVHVATPLAECERRDRKGLYARARAGEIADLVGIDTPYEVPQDADVTIDTTGRTVDECLDVVWALLQQRGYGTRPATRSEEDDD
jgi:sulfate adenylyltransferase